VNQLVEDLARNAHHAARFLAADRCRVAVRLSKYRPAYERSRLTQGPDQQIIDAAEMDENLYHPRTEEKDVLRLVVLVDYKITLLHGEL
jgi:hypothetical protein